MLTKNSRKKEVEEFLEGRGEFIQIDHLTRYIKQDPPIDLRKFAYLKLAEIYENKRMFFDAAKSYKNAVANSLNNPEKVRCHLKECESYIMAIHFVEADKALTSAMSLSEESQKKEIYSKIKEFYKEQAEKLEKDFKNNSASKVYEKLLVMDLSEEEEKEIRAKLLEIHEKLGHLKG